MKNQRFKLLSLLPPYPPQIKFPHGGREDLYRKKDKKGITQIRGRNELLWGLVYLNIMSNFLCHDFEIQKFPKNEPNPRSILYLILFECETKKLYHETKGLFKWCKFFLPFHIKSFTQHLKGGKYEKKNIISFESSA